MKSIKLSFPVFVSAASCSAHRPRTRSSDPASSTTRRKAPTPFSRSSRVSSNFSSGRRNSRTGNSTSRKNSRFIRPPYQPVTRSSPCTTLPTRCRGCRRTLRPGTSRICRSGSALVRATEHLRQHFGAGERARTSATRPRRSRHIAAPYVQVQSYPSGSLFVARLDDPGHGRKPVRHLRAGADHHHQYAVHAWHHPLRLAGLRQPSSPTLNPTPSRPTPASRPERRLLGKINSATLLQIHSQQDTNQILAAVRCSSSCSPRSNRSTRRTAPSITPSTSSRTFPPPCRT